MTWPLVRRRDVKRKTWEAKQAAARVEVERLVPQWDPFEHPKVTGDPFATLFVGRLSYATSEAKLRREFEEYGGIKSIRIVEDKSGISRGYGFIEFDSEKDMRDAYKFANKRRIDGRRVVVDKERGRSESTWRPMRLGGGIGGRGYTKREAAQARAEHRREMGNMRR